MTLPPEKIGDKGQRFEVTYWDSDKQMRLTFGWAETMDGAEQFADAIRLHQTISLPIIRDRGGRSHSETG